jgi:hypothetical protein
VEEAAKSVGYTFSGVRAANHDTGLYSMSYADFVVPLVKAMQEQQQMIAEQKSLIDVLQLENAQVKAHLAKISQALVSAGIVTEQ